MPYIFACDGTRRVSLTIYGSLYYNDNYVFFFFWDKRMITMLREKNYICGSIFITTYFSGSKLIYIRANVINSPYSLGL